VVLPILWLGILAALFWELFKIDSTDDYVGWIPAMAVTQIPAYLALAFAPADRPFGIGRALAVAIPAALVVAVSGFLIGGVVGLEIWGRKPFELRPLIVGFGAGVVVLVVSCVGFARMLVRTAHRIAARRVLRLVLLAGGLGVGAMLLDWKALMGEPGLWLVIVAPITWTLPMWVTVREPPRIPAARAQISR
jgi:hypothetical protein